MELFSVLFSIILALSALTAALLGLNFIWLKKHSSEIPKDSQTTSLSLNPSQNIKINSLKSMIQYYWPLFWQFNPSYWIKHVGIDAYTYLYYQREVLKLFIFFTICSGTILIPFSIWASFKEDILISEGSSLEQAKKYINEINSILDCALVYIVSIYGIFTIFKMRRHLKAQLVILYHNKSEQNEFEKLKAQSVHVRGLFPEDRRGELLLTEIESYLENSGSGKVLSFVIIPDFIEIVDLENQRKRIDDAQKLLAVNEPAVRRFCFPNQLRDETYYEEKIDTIDDDIQKVIMKPILSSGHAFICFDSIETKNKCLSIFGDDSRNTCEACWSIIKDKVSTFSPRSELLKKRRMTSTFQKFDDEAILDKLREKELKLMMSNLPDPIDIFWTNMGGTRGFFFVRRLIINIVAILILIFLTTPTAFIRSLQHIQILSLFDISQYVEKDSKVGYVLYELFPPLLILLINQLFLLLLDYAAFMEKHYSFSHCQQSIFQRAIVYLTLNMLIIPSLTLAAADPLYEIVVNQSDSIANALKNFYFSSTGNFFLLVLIQNGAFSASYHLMRISEIANSYGSSWLAFYKRQYLNDSERWRRKESDTFQYGYFYSQMVTGFAITIIYCVSTPQILLAGVFFYAVRNFVDSFNLLSVFKEEIESEGHIIESVLKYSMICILILQFALSVSFASNGYTISCLLTSLLFILTLLLVFKVAAPIFEDGDSEVIQSSVYENLEKNLPKWERAYSHPLLVSSRELVIQRDERRVSLMIRS